MKDEMNSMASNRVWDLIKLPYGVKAIGCKWVFKTKKDSQGNIERHKACSTPFRSDPIGESEPDLRCSFNSFYLPFYFYYFFFYMSRPNSLA